MKLRSRGVLRLAAPLAALLVLSGCSEGNRPIPYSEVQAIEIPDADVDNQQNTNITNPTLEIPATSPVRDGDPLTLVWSDEFNASALDPAVWFYESGDGTQYGIPQPSFGNNELQWYLPDNVQLADGKLQITARRENAEGYSVTSGRIMTRDRFAFTYGRIEASIKLPPGQGMWPAFWMLSQDDEPNATPGFGTYGAYAQSGEIDIVEAVNLKGTPGPGGVGGGNEIFSTIHFGGTFESGLKSQSETRYTPGVDVTAGFNTYAFEWDPYEMRWYFNGILYKVENSWFSTGGPFPAPFDKPFYVLFNLAAGGNFPGPLGADALPATMEVDWVRAYSGPTPPPPAFDSGLLTNGDFEAGRPFWLSGLAAPISFENLVTDPDNADNTVYFVNVTGANPEQPFLVNLSQKVAITPGETYALSFRARSDRDRTMIAGIGLSGGDFSNTTETVGLTAAWQDFSVSLTADGFGDENSRVLFDMNGENGEVYIDNVRLVVPPPVPPFDGGFVTNGDFETGVLTPWIDGSNLGTPTVTDTEQNGGTYSVNLTAGQLQNVFIRQENLGGPFTAGDTVTVSFDIKGTLTNSSITPQFLGQGAPFATIVQPDIDSDTWSSKSYPVTLEADQTALSFQVGGACGDVPTCVVDVFIDNVSITAP